jgi:hypothetical protein
MTEQEIRDKIEELERREMMIKAQMHLEHDDYQRIDKIRERILAYKERLTNLSKPRLKESILEQIGEAATWEQLAEEAVELAHAALKVARIVRGENPTPKHYGEAVDKCYEEFTDLQIMADELKVQPVPWIMAQKIERFWKRIDEKR